jgi:iron complex transport system permease protein
MTFTQKICIGLTFLAIVLSIAVSTGTANIAMDVSWGIVLNQLFPELFTKTLLNLDWTTGQQNIIWQIRFPRAILGALVGAGLAVTGCVLQTATRNPLADPHLLGVSSGAAFGAIAAIMHLGLIFGPITLPLFAFLGALGSIAMVIFVARQAGCLDPNRLVLSGVAVSFVIMSAANLLIFMGDHRAAHNVMFWMLGGLGLAQWKDLIYPLSIFILCFTWFNLNSRNINALMAGEEMAATLGINVAKFRLRIFVFTALLTSVMVAFSGAIGFVGLMIPHILRIFVGADNRHLIVFSAIYGAIFLVIVDIVARKLISPQELPIGIITGLIGGVFFIWMMRRNLK